MRNDRYVSTKAHWGQSLVWLTWWNWPRGPVSWGWLAWQACNAGPRYRWYAVDIWCMSRTAMHQPRHASSHLWTWLCLSLLLEHDQRLARERCRRLASRKELWTPLRGISMCQTEPTEKQIDPDSIEPRLLLISISSHLTSSHLERHEILWAAQSEPTCTRN